MISIFTPVHPTSIQFLKRAEESLRAQTFQDFEWVVVPNNFIGANYQLPDYDKLRCVPFPNNRKPKGVGDLKAFACGQSLRPIQIELDADDWLAPTALEEVGKAFENPEVKFAYSNCAEVQEATGKSIAPYSEVYGWRYRTHENGDVETLSFPPTAHAMRRVLFAPNHLRAWRRSAYQKIGGHNPDLVVGDDQDLCCRFYLEYGEKGMKHIDKLLYYYLVHKQNTVKTLNAEIQVQSNQNYLKYVEAMAILWAKEHELLCIDLGGRFNPFPGCMTVDKEDGATYRFDLEKAWIFDDNSVGFLRASHIFEHLPDSIHTMNEAYRVLAPGGFLSIEVPSTDGRAAFADPSHRSFFNPDSFRYFTDEAKARFIRPAFKGRFQVSRVEQYKWPDGTPVVAAELICLKPPYDQRPVGEVLI